MTRTRRAVGASVWPFVAFWVVLLSVDVLGDAHRATLQGRTPNMSRITLDAVVWWSTWIVLTPAALGLARLTIPARVGASRAVLLRLAAGLGLAAVHLFVGAAVFTGIDPTTEGLLSRVSRFSGSFFLSEIPIAWALFGLIAMLEGGTQAEELRELQDEMDAVHDATIHTLREHEQTDEPEGRHARRFLVRVGDRIRWIRAEDIDYVSADGNYMQLHVGDKHHLVRRTMSSIQSALDPDQFVRVHRSTIVNVDRIAEVQPAAGGDYLVCLLGGHRLRMSRTYKDGLLGHGE